jgi:DNA-binding MarR family transcriptional regulator
MAKKNVQEVTLQQSNSIREISDAFFLMNAMLHSLSSMLSAETKLELSDLVANEHIRLHGPLTAKEVAHSVQMGSGATTALIDRLEKKGHVKRSPHPTDRRSIVIESLAGTSPNVPKLTEFVKRLDERLENLDPAIRTAMARFMTDVSQDIMSVLATE